VADEAERERVAVELRRIREAVRERSLAERPPNQLLPAPHVTHRSEPLSAPPLPAAVVPPAPPDANAVNELWNVAAAPLPAGLRGVIARLLRRALGSLLDAQVAFNSRQVQLDNTLLAYVEARLAATHRHYDGVLGVHGRHLEEVDERHLILQEELVAHVHDLVQRIDLVLQEAERGRVSLEFALRDLRERLGRLEERLARG
jgi:hypothetical protein